MLVNDEIQIDMDPEDPEPSARIEHDEVDGDLDFQIGTDDLNDAENNAAQINYRMQNQ